MIKSLTAVNFRRHQEIDLRFDDDRQLILIAGANGVGKTTILEAITFALWGEGRHGRRNLDNLVRRGAELEGMSVELVFTVGAETYRVHRRRDGKSVTAVLYANDVPLVEGPQAVTAEIASILGMDSAGFRLAVIAQQKDLDGLASLRPADRAQMITRLLRLDALTAARNAATARFRSDRDVAAGLRGSDTALLEAEIATVEQDLAAASGELRKCQDAFTILEAEIVAGSSVEEAFNAAQNTVARLEGAIEQLRERRDILESDLARVVVPDPPSVSFDSAGLAAESAQLERDIARAESAEQLLRQRRVAEEELGSVTSRSAAIAERLVVLGTPDEAPFLAAASVASAEAATLEETIEGLRVELGSLQGRLDETRRRLSDADGLGDLCDTCGQTVPETHRDAHRKQLEAAASATEEEILAVRSAGRTATEALTERRAEAREQERLAASARADAAEVSRLRGELADLERRANTYQGQLDRIDAAPVDIDALYVKKAQLAIRVAESVEHDRCVRLREVALERRVGLLDEVRKLEASLQSQERTLADARPAADLVARFEARRRSLERRGQEEELLRHWTGEVARLGERRRVLSDQLVSSQRLDERRLAHEQRAVHAAAAARLLADVSERLATQIRPALEGAVGNLLATMSDGRFSSVAISDEYNITVADDGKFRPLSELSGGEVDLVALAVRLALAQVVSERHGSGGAGFLILDECFASQDASRRQSIVHALRNLRGVYSQIFLISHVENIEDAADLVVEVLTTPDRSETEILVS